MYTRQHANLGSCSHSECFSCCWWWLITSELFVMGELLKHPLVAQSISLDDWRNCTLLTCVEETPCTIWHPYKIFFLRGGEEFWTIVWFFGRTSTYHTGSHGWILSWTEDFLLFLFTCIILDFVVKDRTISRSQRTSPTRTQEFI